MRFDGVALLQHDLESHKGAGTAEHRALAPHHHEFTVWWLTDGLIKDIGSAGGARVVVFHRSQDGSFRTLCIGARQPDVPGCTPVVV